MNDLEVRVKALEFMVQGLQAGLEATNRTHVTRVLPRLARLESAVHALVQGNAELARHAMDRRHK